MNLNQLKEKYDGKQITDIEAIAKTASASQEAQHKEFIGALFYLENTKRFRENANYKAATFADYVSGVYGVSVQNYNRSRLAYFRFPVETEKYGAGIIGKVVSRCGSESVPMVVKALDKERKPQPDKIQEVIGKYAKTHLKKRPARPSYPELERENIQLKKRLQEAQATMKQQAEQIEKLKSTVRRYESGLEKLMPPPVAGVGLRKSA